MPKEFDVVCLGGGVAGERGCEPTAPKHHWPGWYAAYIVARERGTTVDEAAKEATLHIVGARERAHV